MPGAAATPPAGFCETIRPVEPPVTVACRWRFCSRAFAFRSDSPTSFGTTPCSGFASTSVTLSYEESVPPAGNWPSTTPSRCFGVAGL
jgi:hypothetical protein